MLASYQMLSISNNSLQANIILFLRFYLVLPEAEFFLMNFFNFYAPFLIYK